MPVLDVIPAQIEAALVDCMLGISIAASQTERRRGGDREPAAACHVHGTPSWNKVMHRMNGYRFQPGQCVISANPTIIIPEISFAPAG